MLEINLYTPAVDIAKFLGLKALDFLGPCKSVKCLVEEDGLSTFVSCSAQFLQYLSTQHPVIHVIYSAAEAHHKQFGSGTTTMLVMLGLWCDAFSHLSQKDVMLEDVVGELQDILEFCISHIYSECLDIHDIVKICQINSNKNCKLKEPDINEKPTIECTVFPIQGATCNPSNNDDNNISWFFNDDFNDEDDITSDIVVSNGLPDIGALSFSERKDKMELEEILSKMVKCENTQKDEDDFDSCFETFCKTDGSSQNMSSKPCDSNKKPLLFESLSKENLLKTHSSIDSFLKKKMSENIIVNTSVIKQSSRNLREYRNNFEEFPESILDYSYIIKQLCHSFCPNHQEITRIVLEAWQQQREYNQDLTLRFDSKALHCCCISGVSSQHSCLVKGVVTPVSSDMLSVVIQNRNQKWKALLFIGDLTPSFVHLGYKNTTSVTNILTKPEDNNNSILWLDLVKECFQTLSVNLLLIQGHVDTSLMEYCLSEDILVIEHVPGDILKAIATSANAPLNTYVSLCDESSIIYDINIEMWNFSNPNFSMKTSYICINVNTLMQTAILCHPSPNYLKVLEDKYWHVVKKLQNCCENRKMFPGNGNMERLCLKFLWHMKDNGNSQKTAVFQCIEEVFTNFLLFLTKRLDDCQDNYAVDFIYEDIKTKVESWRTALKLAILLTRTDVLLINGIENSYKEIVL